MSKNQEPEIKIMTYESRQRFFFTLLVVFLVSLPAFIFYTTGYRIDLGNEESAIVTTGGIYITSENLEVDVYLDEKQVDRPRLFRSAYYIQNIENGLHRAVVQKPDHHTWVKVLPVDSHIVTEAAAFNIPTTPHVRLIPEFINASKQGVYVSASTTTDLWPKATTTSDFIVMTKLASTTLIRNEEYNYIASLFASSTVEASLIDRLGAEINRFQFATTSVATTSTSTESFKERGNMRITERDDDLYVNWEGSVDSTPHYFCVTNTASSSIASRYGDHVDVQFKDQEISTTTPIIYDDSRICRTQIKVDRKRQEFKLYDFLPNSADFIVLQLEDGLYITEIDDRSWQNTQLAYPGSDFNVVVTNDNIYIEEDGLYFELLFNIEE